MKESYYLPDSIEQKAQELIEACCFPRSRQPFQFDPDLSALLILDMQAYFLDSASHAFVPSAIATLPGLRALVEAYDSRGLPIVFTRHQNTPEDAGMMSTWWRELLTPDHPLSAIISELPAEKGQVFTKSQYDAFLHTELETYLNGKTVRQLVIGGVMAHLCCETTARAAFMRGFNVFFLVDGTASYQESYHRSALMNLSHGFARLARVRDILQGFNFNHGK